ncbi:hypothetical protein [Pseudoxanthomonas dokdonensis]|nr:hypothetical protein [Pseudoxanthomonas dokdonensis]
MNAPQPRPDDTARRRRAVLRTALVMAFIAVAIYVAFILSGVMNA